MIRNYFYLIVGCLCILFAVTHTLNGMSSALPLLDNAALTHDTKVAFTYVWHIIGVENAVFGIALLIMAFRKNQTEVRFAAWLIIALLAMRWVVITSVTLANGSNVMQLIPDTIAILAVITLLWFGTKVKDRISDR
jgi:hypothetical protein